MKFALFWLKTIGLSCLSFTLAMLHGAGGLQGVAGAGLYALTLLAAVLVWLHVRGCRAAVVNRRPLRESHP
jgi:hypothetical protein